MAGPLAPRRRMVGEEAGDAGVTTRRENRNPRHAADVGGSARTLERRRIVVSVETDQEIAHLDFAADEIIHYAHPTDPGLQWCGKPSSVLGFGGRGMGRVTCVDCLHLLIAHGSKWWWDMHRTYYQSTCPGPGDHDCRREKPSG